MAAPINHWKLGFFVLLVVGAFIATVIGVGASKRLSAVRWGVAGRLGVAWVLTIPASAIVAALCYWALEMVGLAA